MATLDKKLQETYTDDDGTWAVFEQQVNKKDMSDVIEVTAPADLQTAIDSEESDYYLECLQSEVITRERNKHAATMVSEEEREEMKKKEQDKLKKKADKLKSLGLSADEIMDLIS